MTTLHELFADILDLDPATVSDETSPDNTTAWDSLSNMMLLAAIEETYEVELDSDEITRMTSIGVVRKVLEARGIVAG